MILRARTSLFDLDPPQVIPSILPSIATGDPGERETPSAVGCDPPRQGACYVAAPVIRGFSSVGRALPWHGRGQGFESPKLHAATSGNDTHTPPSRRGFLFSSTQAEHTEPLDDLDAVPPSAPPASGRTSSKSPPHLGGEDVETFTCGTRSTAG